MKKVFLLTMLTFGVSGLLASDTGNAGAGAAASPKAVAGVTLDTVRKILNIFMSRCPAGIAQEAFETEVKVLLNTLNEYGKTVGLRNKDLFIELTALRLLANYFLGRDCVSSLMKVQYRELLSRLYSDDFTPTGKQHAFLDELLRFGDRLTYLAYYHPGLRATPYKELRLPVSGHFKTIRDREYENKSGAPERLPCSATSPLYLQFYCLWSQQCALWKVSESQEPKKAELKRVESKSAFVPPKSKRIRKK